MSWTLETARELCRTIEAVAPSFGAHVALTGGCLYGVGPRKDVDILLYRIRQKEFDMEGMYRVLEAIGIRFHKDNGWCIKASYKDLPVDIFLPDRRHLDYPDDAQDYQ